MFGNEEIPAEQGDFTVGGPSSGDLVCLVEVLNDSGLRHEALMTTGPPFGNADSVKESVAVVITGTIFNGTAARAVAHCGTRAAGSLTG